MDLRPELKTVPGTIPTVVEAAAIRWPNTVAVVDDAESLTFAELKTAMWHCALALRYSGVNQGDRVAIWAPNSARWIIAALGTLAAGGVVVPINTRFRGSEAGDVIHRAQVKRLFTVDTFAGARYLDLLHQAGVFKELEHCVLLEGDDGRAERWDSFLALTPERSRGHRGLGYSASPGIAVVSPEDLSDLIFTSGTTGHPKGVMITHGQSTRVYWSWSEIVGLRHGDRYLVAYPFFHCAGYKSGWLASFMRGVTVVPQRVFDVDDVLQRVERERITVLPGTPTMLQDILDHPRRSDYDLSSLRLTVTGAAVVPVSLVERLRSEMTFERVVTGYGLTETCGTVAMCRYDDDPETIAHWSGRAIPDTELAIFDDSGRVVPAGTTGEIVTRGYHVTRGYFGEPEETAAVVDANGWLHTGDIGVMNDLGYVRITDRKKDMFIVGGFNAYPAEIEAILLQNPAVSQVAVVGVPDHRLGEVGMAFVVARPGESIDTQSLISWCRQNMANYKVPRHVRLMERLPTNPTGKVLKFELRAQGRAELAALQLGGGRGAD